MFSPLLLLNLKVKSIVGAYHKEGVKEESVRESENNVDLLASQVDAAVGAASWLS